jgi:hypothetical protein
MFFFVSASSGQLLDSLTKPCNIPLTDYYLLDVVPEFPGGEEMIPLWLKENTRYPSSARSHDIQGTVWVSFIVDTSGYTICPKIIKGIEPILNHASVITVLNMPQWTPGMKDGKNVFTEMRLPFHYHYYGTLDPLNCHYRHLIADDYFFLEEWELALTYLDKVMNCDSRDTDALIKRFICKRKLGDMDGACKDLEKAASLGDEQAIILVDSICRHR